MPGTGDGPRTRHSPHAGTPDPLNLPHAAGAHDSIGGRESRPRGTAMTPHLGLGLEVNEPSAPFQVSTLQRAADALDCDLVYALVPRQPLDAKVRAQAVKAAMPQLSRVEQTMLLEDQSPSMSAVDELRRDAIEAAIDRPGLWVGD